MHLDVRVCSDCGAQGAQWASVCFNVFLCNDCSSIHRELPDGMNVVKNLCRDSLTQDELDKLCPNANEIAAQQSDRCVPPWYYVPKPDDCLALKYEWIQGRYYRRDFVDNMAISRVAYAQTPFTCTLYKRARDSALYQLKQFFLSENDGLLKYCVPGKKPSTSGFNVLETNACFIPEKMGKSNGLQITVPCDDSIRNFFVYTDMSQDVVNFFQALRCAKYHLLQLAYPASQPESLCEDLTTAFVKEGWMKKASGARIRDSFRRRWFTLYGRYLYYFDTPLSATPKGRLFLGHGDMGYYSYKGLLNSNSCYPPPAVAKMMADSDGIGFTVDTPFSAHANDFSKLNELFFIDFQSATPKGRIFLGHRDMGYYIHKGLLNSNSCSPPAAVAKVMADSDGIGFTVVTPSRDHILLVESELECIRWTEALDSVVNTRIPPKDMARYRQIGENV